MKANQFTKYEKVKQSIIDFNMQMLQNVKMQLAQCSGSVQGMWFMTHLPVRYIRFQMAIVLTCNLLPKYQIYVMNYLTRCAIYG